MAHSCVVSPEKLRNFIKCCEDIGALREVNATRRRLHELSGKTDLHADVERAEAQCDRNEEFLFRYLSTITGWLEEEQK